MGIIKLEGMKFYASHGYYEEERKIGGHYTLHLSIETNTQQAGISDQLEHTVNYETVYQLVKANFSVSSKLLEHVGTQVIDALYEKFPQIEHVTLEILKHNPPLGGEVDTVSLILKK